MPKGIPKSGINKGWFRKGINLGFGFKKGLTPWNKNRKGRQKNHDTSGLLAGWNKGKKMPKITGEKNYQWKGEKVSYRALHKWVIKYLGNPKKCSKCGKEKTTPKSIQWANVDHNYKRNLTDWIALCASCHKIYDQRFSDKQKI
jgi:hypothetical protein